MAREYSKSSPFRTLVTIRASASTAVALYKFKLFLPMDDSEERQSSSWPVVTTRNWEGVTQLSSFFEALYS